MGRIVVSAGNVPTSVEELRLLAEDLQAQLGGENQVTVEGPHEERGAGLVDQWIDVVLEGIQTASTVMVAVAAAVTLWRSRGQAPSPKITRVRAWHIDEDGNRRRIWVEEIEKAED